MKHPFNILIILSVIIIMVSALLCADAAAEPTHIFTVSANTTGGCDIDKVETMSFIDYNPLSKNHTDTSTTMTYRCVAGVTFGFYVDGTRTMKNEETGQTLNFELYTDSAYTNIYPAASQGKTFPALTTNEPQTQTIYGRIEAGQNVGSGLVFSKTLTAVVEY